MMLTDNVFVYVVCLWRRSKGEVMGYKLWKLRVHGMYTLVERVPPPPGNV